MHERTSPDQPGRLDQKKSLANPQNHEQNNTVVILSKWNLGTVCCTAKSNWYTSQSGLEGVLSTHVARHHTMWLHLPSFRTGPWFGLWAPITYDVSQAEKSVLEQFSLLDVDWSIHPSSVSLEEFEPKAPSRGIQADNAVSHEPMNKLQNNKSRGHQTGESADDLLL